MSKKLLCSFLFIFFLTGARSSFAQNTVTVSCTGSAGSYNSGSVTSGGVKSDDNLVNINSGGSRGWAEFDLSPVPAGATVTAVNLIFTTYSSTASTVTNNIYGFTGDASAMAGGTLYTNCASGTSFNALAWTANALNNLTFNSTGNSFIQTNAGGLVNIGYVRGSTNNYNIYGYSAASANQPKLEITYTCPATTSSAATSIACSDFIANWTAVTGAIDYRLDVATDAGFSSFVAGYNNLNVGNVTSYSVTGLSGVTTYYYRLRAITGCGSSANSNTTSLTTTPCNDECAGAIALSVGASGSCTNSTYSSIGGTSSGVTGSGCLGTADDDVWFKFDATCDNITIKIDGAADYAPGINLRSGACNGTDVQCSYSSTNGAIVYLYATGLSVGTTYYVRTYDYYSGASGSGSFDICIYQTIPTGAPTSTAATNITCSDFDANWNAVAGATGYFLDVNTLASFTGTWILNNASVGNVTSYSVTGLSASTTYYYRVRYETLCGSSVTNSGTITTTTIPCNDECANAVALSVGASGSCSYAQYSSVGGTLSSPVSACSAGNEDDDVWFKFDATCPNITVRVHGTATAYAPVVEVLSGNCAALTQIGCNSTSTSSSTIDVALTGLTAGNTYYIRTFDYAAGSGTFEICVFETIPTGAPTSSAASSVTCSSFQANWVAYAGATGYILDVNTNSTFTGTWIINGVDVGNVTSHPVTGLSASTPYYYRVRYYSDCGSSTSNSSNQNPTTIPCNDECANAVSLSVGASGSCAYTGGTTVGATVSGPTDCTVSGTRKDVWYSFVASCPNITINVDGNAGYYPVVNLRSGACNGTSVSCANNLTSGGIATINATSLTVGATYYVLTYDYYGGNNSFSICVYETVPTGAPTSSAASSVTCSSFQANWVAYAGATGYILDINTNSTFTGTWIINGVDVGNVTSHPVTGLSASTPYYYRVRYYSDCGSSTSNSSNQNPTTIPCNDECANAISLSVGPSGSCTNMAGSCLGATNSGLTDCIVSGTRDEVWYSFVPTCSDISVQVDGAAGFYPVCNLRSGPCNGTSVSCASNLSSGGTALLNATGLTIGATYYIRVYDYYSGSGTFNICVFETIPTGAPTATAATNTTCTTFDANWNAVSGATDYYLDVATTSGFTAGTYVTGYQNLNVGNVLTHTVTGLASGTTYYYRVRHGTLCGSSTTNSNTITTPTQSASTAPTSISVSISTVCIGENVVLTKVGGSLGTGAVWAWYSGSCGGTLLGTGTGSTFTVTPSGNTTYYVRAENTCGNTTCASTGITAVTCYMQPTSGASSYTVCSGNFTDNGGLSANYSNNLSTTLTLYPSTAGNGIMVTFSAFTTESGYDSLVVFNGNSTSAPRIGTYSGSSSPGTVSSCATDGSLTFKFVSDAVSSYAGWSGTISCSALASPTGGTASANPSTVCSGGTTLTLSGYSGIIQWQESPAGCGSYTDITGANSATLVITSLTATKCYRAKVSCGGTITYSNAVTVTYSSSFTTNTWNGSTSTDWNTASNWSLGVVPNTCHNVVIPNVTNDPIVTAATGVNNLTVQNGSVLLANAAITVYGTFAINNGGTYIHNNTAAPITTIFNGVENFGASSTFEIQDWPGINTFVHNGSTVATDPMHSTAFGNLTINWNEGSSQWEWRGYMTLASNPRVAGILNIKYTGGNDIHMTGNGNETHQVGALYVGTGGTGGRVVFKGRDDAFVTSYGPSTLNILGDLRVEGGNFWLDEDGVTASTEVITVNVSGNFTMTGGSLDFNYGANHSTAVVHKINLYGNYSQTGGYITSNDNNTAFDEWHFSKNGTQTYTHSGAGAYRGLYERVIHVVDATSTLQLNSHFTCGTKSAAGQTLYINGTFIAGDYNIIPCEYYTNFGINMGSGSRLKTSNAQGFFTDGSTSPTVYDNATTIPSFSLDPNSTIEYNRATPQFLTNGGATPLTYAILDINNSQSGGSAINMAPNGDASCLQLRLRDGVVNTGPHTLTVLSTTAGASGSIQNHSAGSYLNTGGTGMLRRYLAATGSYDFPVGNGDSYQLMNLNLTGGTAASYIDVNFDNKTGAYGSVWPLIEGSTYDRILNNGGINATTGHADGGIWRATPDAGTPTYDLTLYATNFSNQSAQHTIVKRDYAANPNPNAWAFPGTYVSQNIAATITVVRSGISGFSEFAIPVSDVALPVNLLSFQGNCINGKVKLNWSTASEKNNNYFTIARSSDGSTYKTLGTVAGSGNSSTTKNYSFYDSDPLTSDAYYLLSQTDFNGSTEMFAPIKVACEYEGFSVVVNSNLIGNNNINVSIAGAADQVLLVLTDVLGRELYSNALIEGSGNYLHTIRLDQKLAPGIYFVTASSNDTYISQKIVVW